jgi:hypothetical protein
MSSIAVNAITDANDGNTTTINGVTPNSANVVGKNRIINGNMMIDQRNAGASVTATADTYCVDRWAVGYATVNAFTAQQSTTAPSGFYNSLKLTAGTGASAGSGGYAYLRQAVEGFNISDLAWGTANAKAANLVFQVYSSLTGTFGVVIRDTPGNYCFATTYTISSANTWTSINISIPAPTGGGTFTISNGVGAQIFFDLGAGTTWSATASSSWQSFSNALGVAGTTKLTATTGATFYITGVQLEVGESATEFEHRPYTTELQLCQRYYQKFGGSTPYPRILMPSYTTNAYVGGSFPYVTSMRATPTGAFVGTWINQNTLVGSNTISTAAEGFLLYTQSSSSAVISGLMPDATGFITLSSEL